MVYCATWVISCKGLITLSSQSQYAAKSVEKQEWATQDWFKRYSRSVEDVAWYFQLIIMCGGCRPKKVRKSVLRLGERFLSEPLSSWGYPFCLVFPDKGQVQKRISSSSLLAHPVNSSLAHLRWLNTVSLQLLYSNLSLLALQYYIAFIFILLFSRWPTVQLVLWIRTMICYLEIFHSVCMPAAIHWPRLSFQKVSQIRVLCYLILLYQSICIKNLRHLAWHIWGTVSLKLTIFNYTL